MAPSFDSETSNYVRQALAHDQGSIGWVIERFTPLLLAQARFRLGARLRNLYDPQDVVNDTWLIVLSRIRTIDLTPRDGRFTPVFLRFLSTTVLRHINNLKVKHLSHGSLDDAAELLGAVPADDSSSVLLGTMRSELNKKVLAAIDAMTAEERDVLLMRGIEQAPYAELAEKLDVSEGTLRSRFHHAVRKLRGILPRSLLDEMEVGCDG